MFTAAKVLDIVPVNKSGRLDRRGDGYFIVAAYIPANGSDTLIISQHLNFGVGGAPDSIQMPVPFPITSTVITKSKQGITRSIDSLMKDITRFDSSMGKALSRDTMINELEAFMRSKGLLEDLHEAVDPQAFGELRSLLQAPYKGWTYRGTFLRAVADLVGRMIRDAGKDQGAVDTIIAYADGVLGNIEDQELLSISTFDVRALINRGDAKAQRLEPAALELMRTHQLAILNSSRDPLEVTPAENTQDLLKLRFGSVPPFSDDGSFYLYTDGAELVDRSDEAKEIIAAVARGHKRLRLYVAGSVTFTSVPGTLKDLATITPSGADLVAEVKVAGWDVARRRTGLDPIPALMSILEQPRNRISGTNGRLTVLLEFERYVVDSADVEELEAAVEAGIIKDFGPAGYQSMVSITFN
jgi:hypothetical protein